MASCFHSRASTFDVIRRELVGSHHLACLGRWPFGYAALVDQRSPRTPMIRIVLAVGAIVLASLRPRSAPRRRPEAAADREPEVLQRQVLRLFDQLDQVSRVIESVLAERAWAHERISELSRQTDALQQQLNRRAAEAYMGELAVGVDSVLGASSISGPPGLARVPRGDLSRGSRCAPRPPTPEGGVRAASGSASKRLEVAAPGQARAAGGNRCRPRREARNGNTPASDSRPRSALRKSVPSPTPHPRRLLRVHPLRPCPPGGEP